MKRHNKFLKLILFQKEVVNKFRDNSACTFDLAKSFKDLGLEDSVVLRKLIRKGVLIHAGSSNYFLDERALLNYRLNRVKWAMIVLIILTLIIIGL